MIIAQPRSSLNRNANHDAVLISPTMLVVAHFSQVKFSFPVPVGTLRVLSYGRYLLLRGTRPLALSTLSSLTPKATS